MIEGIEGFAFPDWIAVSEIQLSLQHLDLHLAAKPANRSVPIVEMAIALMVQSARRKFAIDW
jgi:hypothetical protein